MSDAHKPTKGLSLAFFLNLIFAIIEFIGGYFTQSTAIITDAFHDLMDAIAIGIAVWMDKFSKKEPSKTYTFGYRRYSLLSGIILSTVLLIGGIVMVQTAIISFGNPKEVHSEGMFLLALLGITINGFAFLKIRKGNEDEHHHSHGHAHQHTSKDANSKAIMLHLLEDVLGWIAVLIGAAIMYFTQWYWIDALLTIAIALFIGYNAITNLWQTFKILLQKVPDGISIDAITKEIEKIDGVINIQKIKIWSIDGSTHVANLHIEIKIMEHSHRIRNEINELLRNEFQISETTIEVIS